MMSVVFTDRSLRTTSVSKVTTESSGREVDSSRRPCVGFDLTAFFSGDIIPIHKDEILERLLASL